MANASLDENGVPTALGVSNIDGKTTVALCADPVFHTLCVDNGSTGGDTITVDIRDENRKVAFMAVSSVDGATPIPIYADAITNKLLINSL
jgi:hypothetical protein